MDGLLAILRERKREKNRIEPTSWVLMFLQLLNDFTPNRGGLMWVITHVFPLLCRRSSSSKKAESSPLSFTIFEDSRWGEKVWDFCYCSSCQQVHPSFPVGKKCTFLPKMNFTPLFPKWKEPGKSFDEALSSWSLPAKVFPLEKRHWQRIVVEDVKTEVVECDSPAPPRDLSSWFGSLSSAKKRVSILDFHLSFQRPSETGQASMIWAKASHWEREW